MAETSTQGLGDLLGLIGGSNPFAGISKSISQFQRGVSQFLDSVEKFNATMDELNGVAVRINSLLDTVEEPVKAFVPQVTRTIRAADTLVEQLSGPVERMAPSLARFAETMSSPIVASFPKDLGAVMQSLNDLAQRLQPLGQLAETAGGWFGLRPLAALRSGGGNPRTTAPPAPTSVPTPTPAKTPTPTPAKPAVKKPAAKTAAKKAVPAKKAPAKTAAAKRAPAKKAGQSRR